MDLNPLLVDEKLREFLNEDLGHLGINTDRNRSQFQAVVSAQEPGIVCGLYFFTRTLDLLAQPLGLRVWPITRVPDGQYIVPGEELILFAADQEVLRLGIRTGLNLLGHLSGIATNTSAAVQKVAGYPVKLLDTRKTTPGLRMFEKYAVRVGGGYNHRFNRTDGELIKKEDILLDGGIKGAIDRAFERKGYLTGVEVEVETLQELEEVLRDGRVNHVMLDNMDLDTMRQASFLCDGRCTVEASGIGDMDLAHVADTGVDYISMSSLITSAKPLKIHMKILE